MTDDPDLNTSAFHATFLVHANEFATNCTTACAKAVREASDVPETRGTPTKALAAELRSQAFDKLDAIFVEAFALLQASDADLGAAINSIRNTDVLGSALEGALAGGLIGTAFNRTTTGALVGASIEADREFRESSRAFLDGLRSSIDARKAAEAKFREWMVCCLQMPEPLIDWIGAKSFGGKVDFALQRACIAEVQANLEGHVREAIATCDALDQHRISINERDDEAEKKAQQEEVARRTQQERERREAMQKRWNEGVGLLNAAWARLRKSLEAQGATKDSIRSVVVWGSWLVGGASMLFGALLLFFAVASIRDQDISWGSRIMAAGLGVLAIYLGNTVIRRGSAFSSDKSSLE